MTQEIQAGKTPQPCNRHLLQAASQVDALKATIRQLQESENRYRQLYDHAPIMVHTIDLIGNILSVSDAWVKQLGYQTEDVINQPFTSFLSEQSQINIDTALAQTTASKPTPPWLRPEGCEHLNCQLVRKNGELIDVQLSAIAEQDAEGNTQKLVTVLLNVTARHQAEQDIQHYQKQLKDLIASQANELTATNQQLQLEINERIQAQAELDHRAASLERSNADLEQFAYVVSHDLQEPIRAMTVFSQLLQQRYRDQLDDTANNYIAHIVEGGIRMQALIDGILEFSRITHQGQQFQQVAMGPLVRTVIENLSTTLETNQACVTVDPLPTVSVDSKQISQLFQNLISNAVKFRRDEPPKIHITATALASESHQPKQWQFSVKDNGIGIPEEQQKRIFALFQRLHTRQEATGYGIGLAICKKIIERHNGNIWVESLSGNGTTFLFTLNE